MKKISIIIFALFVATNASTFSELEKRVADLEQQVTKLTIKLLDREMAKESPILNMAVDTTTSISGLIDSTLIESDEDEGEDEQVGRCDYGQHRGSCERGVHRQDWQDIV